jgi:hypothetical protein
METQTIKMDLPELLFSIIFGDYPAGTTLEAETGEIFTVEADGVIVFSPALGETTRLRRPAGPRGPARVAEQQI